MTVPAPTSCPDCGAAVRLDRERLCPRCGFPLMFLRADLTAEAPAVVARMPGERDDDDGAAVPVTSMPPADDDTPPTGDVVVCRRCRQHNPPDRVRCARCGAELRAAAPVATPLPPMPTTVRVRRRWPYLVVAATLTVLVAVAAVLLVRGLRDPRPAGAGATSPGPVPVPARDVRVSVSSTNPDDPRFPAAHLLDGDARTAWQSDGKRLRSNIGVRLTFRFVRPVRLARITVVNGDARSGRDFRANERVARLSVRRDTATTVWSLADRPQAQSLDLDGAETASVVLVVEAVYAGQRWPDVAISDVGFAALPR